MLRLFNDCFAAGTLFVAIYFYQRRIWTVGSVAFSFGVGIKMVVLLGAPAIGVILLQVLPIKRAWNAAFFMAQVQVRIQYSKEEGESDKGDCSSYSHFRFLPLTHKAT